MSDRNTYRGAATPTGEGIGTITGVTAGTGLSGGGTSGNVSLAVNTSIIATVSYVDATLSDGSFAPVTRVLTAGTGLTGGGDLSADRAFAVDTSVIATKAYVDSVAAGEVPATRTLNAGNGLTGGGDLSVDRTFSVDQTFSPTWSGTHTFSNPITVSSDADSTSIIGRTKISSALATDTATVSHFDMANATDFGFAQLATGSTVLNSKTGTRLIFAQNGSSKWGIEATTFQLSDLGTGSWIDLSARSLPSAPSTGVLSVFNNSNSLYVFSTDNTNNAASTTLTIDHKLSSGSALTAFGSGIQFKGTDSTTDSQNIGAMHFRWTNSTHGSVESKVVFQGVTNGGAQEDMHQWTFSNSATAVRSAVQKSSWGLILEGNLDAASTSTDVVVNSQAARTAGALFGTTRNDTAVGISVPFRGGLAITNNNLTVTAAQSYALKYTYTGHTVSDNAEAKIIDWNGSGTITLGLSGTLATQRVAHFQAPTIDNGSAQTITNLYGYQIDLPQVGSNITPTNYHGFVVGSNVGTIPTAASLTYTAFEVPTHTVTLSGTTGVTSARGVSAMTIRQMTITNASAAAITNAASLYIEGAPIAAGSITLSNTYAISAAANTDSTFVFGRLLVDSRTTNIAFLSHYAMTTVNQFALRQDSAGQTRINAASGQSIEIQIAGTSRWNVSSSGHILATADNTYDIGASGATRPRSIYAATNVSAAGDVMVGSNLRVGYNGTSNSLLISASGQTVNFTSALNQVNFTFSSSVTQSTGTQKFFRLVPPSNTGQTASTEISGFSYETFTRTWAAGAISNQREFTIAAPTYAFASASTITNAATLYVSGAPIQGTNATLSNSYGAWLVGPTRFDTSGGAVAWLIDSSGHLICPTAGTFDIGQSGATQPRHLYVSNDITFGGSLKFNGSDVIASNSSPSRTTFSYRIGTNVMAELIGNQTAAATTDADIRLNTATTRTAGRLVDICNNTTRKWTVMYDARMFYGVPNSAPTDGDLQNNEITWYLDEATPAIKARIKKSDASLLTLAITNGASPTLA